MLKLSLAAVLLVATPLLGQQTGVSNPPDDAVEDSVPAAAAPVVTPPVVTARPAPQAYDAAVPALPPAGEDSPAVTLQHRDLSRFDPDGRIVGDDVVHNGNIVPSGAMFRARLQTLIRTDTTQPGTPFRAQVTEPLTSDGRVIVPAGSIVEGNVTDIRGGRRLHGPALIHLQAQTVVLPDGIRMPVRAGVIDTDKFADTRIDSEGNIIRKDHVGQSLATLSVAAGGAAAAGGLIAGVPGALVGAGIGAGVSTIMWLKADRQTELPPDTTLVLALESPLTIRPLVNEPDYSASPMPPSAPTTRADAQPAQPEPQAFVPMN